MTDIRGAMWGLLVGDAFGVPYEFHGPHELPDTFDMVPPPDFRRAHPGVPTGTWSDDGALALCLLESLLNCGRLDTRDLAHRFLAWWDNGHLAVDKNVFDIGMQTRDALEQIRRGVPPESAGGSAEASNGNGSLMRVLPLALWHKGSDASLVQDAHRQSALTHAHPRSQACCALYCLWARSLHTADPWATAVQVLTAEYRTSPAHAAELHDVILPAGPPRGTGYVVDTLMSARHALAAGSYEATVLTAVALGHDTDTTACVAGGLAGLRHGLESIPPRWLNLLRGKDIATPLIERLAAQG